MISSIIRDVRLLFKELSACLELFDPRNDTSRAIVFYSEKDIYYQYFAGLIDYLLENSRHAILYITSDPEDPVFHRASERFKPLYVKHLVAKALAGLEAEALLMTMPDLNHFHIKRASPAVRHIYMFHAVVSTHMQYRRGAFDHYDVIFCVGPHQVKELRRAEELYNLEPKVLVAGGYHRLEKIHTDHRAYRASRPRTDSARKTILVAPTWGESSILESHGIELVSSLAKLDHDVSIRPHPEIVRRRPGLVSRIEHAVRETSNVSLESDLVSDASLHQADVLITDRSGIAYEYAFGTERPVLFIDTPLKIQNADYTDIGIEPLEVISRGTIGISMKTEDLPRLGQFVSRLLNEGSSYVERIIECRSKYLFNWGEAARIEGEYVLSLCSDGETGDMAGPDRDLPDT